MPSKEHVDTLYNNNIYIPTKTYWLNDDDNNGDGIDANVANNLIKGLHLLDSIKLDMPINIILNSQGGDSEQGMAMYDAICGCSCDVYITVIGCAYSVAAWILQAGDVRMMSSNSKLMIHTGSYALGDNHPRVNRAWAEHINREEVRFENILLERIQERWPDYTRKQLRYKLRFDTILNPQESVELGLIDRVRE